LCLLYQIIRNIFYINDHLVLNSSDKISNNLLRPLHLFSYYVTLKKKGDAIINLVFTLNLSPAMIFFTYRTNIGRIQNKQ
jgi:hypothetical protein